MSDCRPRPEIEHEGYGHGMSWPRAVMWTVVVFACFAALCGAIFALVFLLPPVVPVTVFGVAIFVSVATLIKTGR